MPRRDVRVALQRLATVLACVCAVATSAFAQDIALDCEREAAGWHHVALVDDGARGRAARFAHPEARIDLGACPIGSDRPFGLSVRLRTRSGAFATALMARTASRIGVSLVVGREPGKLSLELWSWETVRLVSRSRIDDGRWHTVEAAYDSAHRRAVLLIDGVLEAWGDPGEGGAPDAVLRLGDNIGARQPFAGDLDELVIAPRHAHAERFAALQPWVPPTELSGALAALRRVRLPRASPRLADLPRWTSDRAALRERIADALGLVPLPAAGDLDVTVHGVARADGLLVERVSWTGWPGQRATGWLWRPDPAPVGRLPAVLSLHGHWRPSWAGIDGIEQARASRFARGGYAVLVVDAAHVEHVAAGVSPLGVMTWNNLRGLALLRARGDVDPERIATTGASGGALQAMALMALDSRLAAAAPVCMTCYLDEILDDVKHHCGCNHAPRLGAIVDMPELCALFAPRPVLFASVTGDWTARFPTEGLGELRAVWTGLGAADRLEADHREAPHGYHPEQRALVHAFFDRHLRPGLPAGDGREHVFDLRALAVLGPPPAEPDRVAVAAEHVARRGGRPLAALAPALPWRVGRVDIAARGAARGGWIPGSVTGPDGVSVPVALKDGGRGDEAVLVAVDVDGTLLADAPAWLANAPRALAVQPRWCGAWAPCADAWRRNGLLLGAGEAYQAAHDLALACASAPGSGDVTVVARGRSGVAALLAAPLCSRIRTLVITDLGPTYTSDGDRVPLAPELLRWGDLPELVAAIGGPRHIALGGLPASGAWRPSRGVVWEPCDAPLDDLAVARILARP